MSARQKAKEHVHQIWWRRYPRLYRHDAQMLTLDQHGVWSLALDAFAVAAYWECEGYGGPIKPRDYIIGLDEIIWRDVPATTLKTVRKRLDELVEFGLLSVDGNCWMLGPDAGCRP